MMRGSLIIFAGILSVVFLRRKLHLYNWTGMLVTVVGLVLVGMKSVFTSTNVQETSFTAIFGIILALAGSFASACQMVVEERFLKVRGFHPLQAVGMEGLFGTILMAAIALPAAHYIHGNDLNGSSENFIDALYQMVDNGVLLFNCILYVLSIAFFNYCGLAITKNLSAVHRTLIDALRNLFVWACSIVLFYSTSGSFGEALSRDWTLMQIDGFMCLVIGALIYNKVIDLTFIPCCRVRESPEEEEEEEEDQIGIVEAAEDGHSNEAVDEQDEATPIQSSTNRAVNYAATVHNGPE